MAKKKPSPSPSAALHAPWRVDGTRMREARAAKKLRQVDIVFLTGLTHAIVSKLENDHDVNLTLNSFGRLCDVLEVSADWICRKSERRSRSK